MKDNISGGKVLSSKSRKTRRGIAPQSTAGKVNAIQTDLATFEPATEGQKTLHAEAYREFTRSWNCGECD